ncbi:MAG: hypothetical protein CME10_14045, partial [Gemmatimonadetes bacterium]|nr:hypothetical protein [Gemmatimonadota bacterium]
GHLTNDGTKVKSWRHLSGDYPTDYLSWVFIRPGIIIGHVWTFIRTVARPKHDKINHITHFFFLIE